MERTEEKKLTPMMEQWFKAKHAHPDAILLFRMGDFYELFDSDAVTAAPILDLALTCRDKDKSGMKMAGFPFLSADGYIEKLVEHGFKVAVCEQLEDPKQSKGLVKRGITNVITPGTALIGESYDHHAPSYLLSLRCCNKVMALAVIDLQTSSFLVSSTVDNNELMNEVVKFSPREIVIYADDEQAVEIAMRYKNEQSHRSFVRIEKRTKQTQSLPQTLHNIALNPSELDATALVLNYIKDLKGCVFSHIGLPKLYTIREQLLMDEASRSNLDLMPKSKGDRHNLFSVLNATKTAVGRRALFNYLMAPSTSLEDIKKRLDLVAELMDDSALRARVRDALSGFFDVEKLTALACAQKISPRGLAQIRNSLRVVEALQTLGANLKTPELDELLGSIADFTSCKQALDQALVEEPPLFLKDGGSFKTGFDAELDGVTNLITNGKEMLLQLEAREREATRIASLKVKFTRVFGYYIEITKTHLEKVPAHYQRKQTIAQGERFVTAELIELEGRLNTAQENAQRLEEARFYELRHVVINHADMLGDVAKKVAIIDVIASFAERADERAWVRPSMHPASSRVISIKNGRHPMVEERVLAEGSYFVPNDVELDGEVQNIALITGPNMAGKSTIMRQCALIQIMAQIGCFVPAQSATLSLCDAIFARVGASDDPASGRSTFMVEMTETAAILSNASAKSLIILDEIGRGTSTYDGMSIAQAVCEHLHDRVQARTLFATHYHELTKLEDKLERLRNFHVGVDEQSGRIHFLFSLRRGPALKSFGIEVARLSGLPSTVLDRALLILENLQAEPTSTHDRAIVEKPQEDIEPKVKPHARHQELIDKILSLDINRTTPLQALNKIATWQTSLRKEMSGEYYSQGILTLR